MLSLYQSDLTKSTFTDDLQRIVVLRLLASAQEPQKVGFGFPHRLLLPILAAFREIGIVQDKFEILGSTALLEMDRHFVIVHRQRTSHFEPVLALHSP